MAVEMIIQFKSKYLKLPINPENLQPTRSASNTNIDIIGIGPATRKGNPGLMALTISSFFPGYNSYYYTGVLPKTCIEFIEEIWNTENTNNTVAKITTTGLPVNINMYFVIESFDYEHKAGEEEDIYYDLKIKEYKPYGVKKVKVENNTATQTVSRTESTSKTNTSNSSSKSNTKTYTVQKGDCLWNIAKAASGNGNNWKQLYNLNKKVIGSNPNSIKAGQKLTLPDGWKLPTKVTKLKSVTTKSKKTSTSKTTSKSSGVDQNVKKPEKTGRFWATPSPSASSLTQIANRVGGGGFR